MADTLDDDYEASTLPSVSDEEVLLPDEQELFEQMNEFFSTSPLGASFSALLETIMQRFLFERQQRLALEALLRDQVIGAFEQQLQNLKVAMIDQKLRSQDLAQSATLRFKQQLQSSNPAASSPAPPPTQHSTAQASSSCPPTTVGDDVTGDDVTAADEAASEMRLLLEEVEALSQVDDGEQQQQAAEVLPPVPRRRSFIPPPPSFAPPPLPQVSSHVPIRISIPKRGMYKTISVDCHSTAGTVVQLLLERAFPEPSARAAFDGWVLRAVLNDNSTRSLLPDVQVLQVDGGTDQFIFTPSDSSLVRSGSIGLPSPRTEYIRKNSAGADLLQRINSSGQLARPARPFSSSSASTDLPSGRPPRDRPPSLLTTSSSSSSSSSVAVVLETSGGETVPIPDRAQKILTELLHSEQEYVRDLTFIYQEFFVPIQGHATYISDSDYGKLLSCLDALVALNRQICKELHARPQYAGTVLCGHTAELLKNYSRYAAENFQQLATLGRLKHDNQHFAQHVAKFEKRKEAQHNNVESFLAKPIQRICKYPLLLAELCQAMPPSLPDLAGLQRALQKTKDVTNDVNEMKRFSENLHALQAIQERIQGIPPGFKLIISTRYFVQEDVLVKISKGKHQSRHFWLFNDLLLYAKPHGTGLRFAGRVMLGQMLVRDVPDAKYPHAFEIDRRDKKKKVYTIIAPDARTKQKWFKALVDLLAEQNKIQSSSRLSVRLRLRDTVQLSPGQLPV